MAYDIAGAQTSPLQAFMLAKQGAEEGRQRGEQSRLARLVSQGMSSPGGLRAIAPEVASFNPEAAFALEDRGDAQIEQRRKLLSDRARLLSAMPVQQRAQAWPSMRAELAQLDPELGTLPEQYDDAQFGPVIQQLAGVGGEGTPAQMQVFEAQARAAGLVPGSEEYKRAAAISLGLEGRASSAGMGFDMVEDANGIPRPQRRDPRTGQVEMYVAEQNSWIPLGGGAGYSQPRPQQNGLDAPTGPVQAETAEAMVARIEAAQGEPLPPAVRQQVLADFQRNGGMVDTGSIAAGRQAPPPAPPPLLTAPPGLGRGRTKEQEAAAVEAAKLREQMRVAPEQATLEADAARQKKEAEALAERNAAAAKAGKEASDTVTIINEAINLLPEATGGILGQVRDAGARAANQSTEGSRATARLKLLAAKLVANVPRFEGPQSNIDVQFYREAAGDLGNPNLSVGERLAAAELMLEIAQRYAGQGGGQGETGAYRIGQVIEANGKRYRVTGGDMNDPDVEEIQ